MLELETPKIIVRQLALCKHGLFVLKISFVMMNPLQVIDVMNMKVSKLESAPEKSQNEEECDNATESSVECDDLTMNLNQPDTSFVDTQVQCRSQEGVGQLS